MSKITDIPFPSLEEITQTADINRFGAFDYAVPQSWADQNPKVRAVWIYDKRSGLCGRPLLVTTILRLARRKCQDKWLGMKIQAALDSYKHETAAQNSASIAA